MKLSKYVLKIPKGDKLYIYSVMTSSLVCLTANLNWEEFDNERLSRFLVKDLKEEDIRKLRDMNILIDDEVDESSVVKEIYKKACNQSSVIDLTLVPTLNCNMNCQYCFQKGIRKQKFTDIGQDIFLDPGKLYDFIESYISKLSEIKRVNVVWFGGEPLLRKDVIKNVSIELQDFFLNCYIEPSFEFITNGTLITDDFVEFARALRRKKFQITIDGWESSHDKLRHFNEKEGSFKIIIQNIAKILSDTSSLISVRINLGRANYNLTGLRKLLSVLIELGANSGRLNVEFPSPITNTEWYSNTFDIYEFAEISVDLLRLYKELGFEVEKLIFGSAPICTARNKYSLAFDYEGKIYKCWEHVGEESMVLGDIFSGIDYSKYAMWEEQISSFFIPEKCSDCCFFPNCFGGCPLFRIRGSEPTCPASRFLISKAIINEILG
ncbi:MAG: radical SAM protein [candidate division WOR-3 bacterium]